ncbi:unnamed protein product [Dovyalis caffra]|uniref:Protein phosphatase n=1 Tax=Dovyalis caffra TaxID=77055 RepID=A0AAV1QSB5_9ROSI|nr:unnamed protein product [Dovyalis caffra]
MGLLLGFRTESCGTKFREVIKENVRLWMSQYFASSHRNCKINAESKWKSRIQQYMKSFQVNFRLKRESRPVFVTWKLHLLDLFHAYSLITRIILTTSKEKLHMNTRVCYFSKDMELKPESLGEDAHFICQERQTFGVANGVSGWPRKGIDSEIFARELMMNYLNAL